MKVKIGNKLHDSKEEPIMLILEGYNKEDISNMEDDANKYCEFPDGMDMKEIAKFMDEKGCIDLIEENDG